MTYNLDITLNRNSYFAQADMEIISEYSKFYFEMLVKTLCTKVATVKTLLLILHAMLFVQPQCHKDNAIFQDLTAVCGF